MGTKYFCSFVCSIRNHIKNKRAAMATPAFTFSFFPSAANTFDIRLIDHRRVLIFRMSWSL